MRDIGINAELTILAAPEFISRMVNGEFDLIFHLILPFDRIPADYYRYMASTGRHAQKGPPNLELDEAMNRAAKGHLRRRANRSSTKSPRKSTPRS